MHPIARLPVWFRPPLDEFYPPASEKTSTTRQIMQRVLSRLLTPCKLSVTPMLIKDDAPTVLSYSEAGHNYPPATIDQQGEHAEQTSEVDGPENGSPVSYR